MLLLELHPLVTPGIGLIFWTTLSFLILLLVLRKFAWKPILTAVKERDLSIEVALQQAEKAREEMARLTSDNQKLLNEAKEERARIIKEAKDLGEKIISEHKEKALTEFNKKVGEATREIQNQKMAALTEVKNSAGLLAVEVAERILKKELSNKKAQEDYASELVEDFKLN
jgi:F-type H+-transporting ATPase subunit b